MSAIEAVLGKRLMILDGGMGTMIQDQKLSEADYRTGVFAASEKELKGNHELLNLTRPEVVGDIHRAYLRAGADIITTNSFNANRISQADYGLSDASEALNLAAARIAREAADEAMREDSDRARFVVGALGPTNRMATLSPDVNDPSYRNISFVELVEAYTEALAGVSRRRQRSDHDRDGLRHAQCQGGDFCVQAVFRKTAAGAVAAFGLRHDHRCQRAHARRSDG